MATLPWLEQVKEDAKRITLKRIRENQEEQAYQAEKRGVALHVEEQPAPVEEDTPEPATSKAKSAKKGK